MNLSYLKTALVLLLLLGLFACSQEEMNLRSLNETIYVRHRGADMPAYVHGNASENLFLIYLHGGPGGWGLEARINTMITEVEKNNAVVYFDQRGSGNAQGNYSSEEVSVDAMAEDVLALVKVLKNRYGTDAKFFLMGASWGGTLGTATLLKNQEAFLGWIDVAGVHSFKDLYFEYQLRLPEKANEQINLGNSIPHWEGVLTTVAGVDTRNFSDESAFRLNRAAHASEAVLAQDMVINEPRYLDASGERVNTPLRNNMETVIILTEKGLWRDLTFTDQLPSITLPALVLWGKHDIVVPTRFAQEAYDLLGSASKELVIFERSGHSPLESEPDLFAEKVIGFINEYR